MRARTSGSRRCAAPVSALLLLAASGPALARNDAILDQVAEQNRAALEAYGNLETEQAADLLRDALETCAGAGLDGHKVKARTHFNLGIVLAGGLRQRELAIRHFKSAVEIHPSIKPTAANLMSPEVEEALGEAQVLADAGAGPAAAARDRAAAPSPPPAPRKVAGIFHQPVADGTSGRAVPIAAAVGPGLPLGRVVLAYRADGLPDFLARDMRKDGQGWYRAEIPAGATDGEVVEYYVEARSRADQAIAVHGSADEPHVVTLEAPAPVAEIATAPGRAPDADARTYWLSMGLGSGGGYAKGAPELHPSDGAGTAIDFGGVAPAGLFHLAPEVGFFRSPTLLLSVQGRLQFVTSANKVRHENCAADRDAAGVGTCSPAKGALAILGKATWLLGPPARLRPFVSASLGGGEIRHSVTIRSLRDCGPGRDEVCKDTVAGGALLFGPGGGVAYELSPRLAFVAQVGALVGVPRTTVNLDLNLGMAVALGPRE